ncbi:MAG: glycosyltransferase [Deltaproteobacteria bacterium]|nr:glycosyltransferase [Deltaproteobacteria bacterium]
MKEVPASEHFAVSFDSPDAGTLLREGKPRPEISVLMPTFNNARFLSYSIPSILNQSIEDFEFIIIDDGSNDGSGDLLEEYAQKDKRIKLIRNENNMGIVFSLNRGLQNCQGEYIVRMDADDISLRDRLQKQIEVMQADPGIAVLGAALSYIDASGNELGMIRRCTVNKSLIMQNPLLHPTVVIRKSYLKSHGLGYLEKYRFAEDYFLWLQLSRVGRLAAIDDIVLKYRLSNQATRVRNLKSVLLATLKVKKNAVFTLGIKPSLPDVLKFLAEGLLLLMPGSLILWVYLKKTFRKGIKGRI